MSERIRLPDETAPRPVDGGRVVLVARFRARRGRIDSLRHRLELMVRLTTAERGCVRYQLHEERADPDRLVLLEEWEHQHALDRHMETDHVRAFVRDVPDLALGEIELLHLRPL